MKTPERLKMVRIYGHLYRRHLEAGGDCCFYCGDERQTLDHRPPLNALNTVRSEDFRRMRIPFCLIPSCHDCNRRLGDKPLWTVLEAVEFIARRLEREYERRAALWTEPEIAELGYSLRCLVRGSQIKLKELHRRVIWAQRRSFSYDLMPVYAQEGPPCATNTPASSD